MKPTTLLALAFVLAGCAPANGPEAASANTGEAKSPHAFEVQLTFTPRTIEKLEGMREMVTVSGAIGANRRPKRAPAPMAWARSIWASTISASSP